MIIYEFVYSIIIYISFKLKHQYILKYSYNAWICILTLYNRSDPNNSTAAFKIFKKNTFGIFWCVNDLDSQPQMEVEAKYSHISIVHGIKKPLKFSSEWSMNHTSFQMEKLIGKALANVSLQIEQAGGA